MLCLKMSLNATAIGLRRAVEDDRHADNGQTIENAHGEILVGNRLEYRLSYPVTDRSIDVQILGLRKKLASRGELIETVRGVGYRLKDGTRS